MRCLALGLLAFLASGGAALADTCDNFRTPAQVLAGLSSSDDVARLEAKTCGLKSDDPAVRGVLLQQLIVGINTMSFDVNPELKDSAGAQIVNELAQFMAVNIQWGKDGRSFVAEGFVRGQFLGESLGINFPNVPLKPQKSGDAQQNTSCSATLTLPKDATEMTGTLRCTGIASRFVITLGL